MVYQVNYILTGPQRTNQSHILPWNARFPRISRSLFQIGSFDSARTELATVQPTHALLARLLQDIDVLQFDAKLKWFSLARNNSIQYR